MPIGATSATCGRRLGRTCRKRPAVRVAVKWTHIVGAEQHERRCPVARALAEAIGHECAVGMIQGVVYYAIWRDRRVALPCEVRAKIREYDKTGQMQPFTFKVNL
jgi:hypothetical protein